MTASLRDPILLPVTDPSQVGEARRVGVRLAGRLGFDDARANDLAIVLTEVATNVLRHGGGGELVLRPLDRDGAAGVEVLAVDRGPGIPSLPAALRDGFSTGGTAGTGLGAVRRLAAEFDLYSTPRTGPAGGATAGGIVPPGGTVLMARLWDVAAPPPPPGGVDLGVVCLPKPGETACGDAWGLHAADVDATDATDGRRALVVADGLGHGLHAAEASRAAVRLFREHAAGPAGRRGPAAVLEAMHPGLRGTRGAAVAVVELPPAAAPPATPAAPPALRFAGVGNIAGVVVGAGAATAAAARAALSHNGTLGVEARRFQEFAYAADPGGLLVLHSDGIGSHWRLADYPGLLGRHPAVVAGVLYRDHRRVRDDATVLVIRLGDRAAGSGASSGTGTGREGAA